MFFHQDAIIKEAYVHRVGNKSQDEFYVLSENSIDLEADEVLPDLLMQYYAVPFAKSKEVYRLHHPSGEVMLNEVYNFVSSFFDGQIYFRELSEQLAKHLYDVSSHPNIKGGELHIVHFLNIQMEGEEHEAIGIFKTENKNAVLQINPHQEGFKFGYINETISIDALDKGAIIINTEAEEGYKVLIKDAKNIGDSVYWKDDFLKLIARNDNYQQTTNIMNVAKNFILEKLDDSFELDTSDKADLLNRTVNYFKQHETYEADKFENEVFSVEPAVSMFQQYKKDFEFDYETPIDDSFDISTPAVKKIQASFKKVIKLDKNFLIHVQGKRDLIERGFDEEKGMNFYKVYFENES